jgi:hypothetical protein
MSETPDDTPDPRTDPDVDEVLAEQTDGGADASSREQISMPPEEGTADDPASFLDR